MKYKLYADSKIYESIDSGIENQNRVVYNLQ